MNYRFATERPDYSHLASGRVLYSLPGHPAFPIRLASEIFQRCLAQRERQAPSSRYVLYDPCCGAGYSLSVLAFLHGHALRAVVGSDVDEQAVRRARQNLDLLTVEGLERRAAEVSALLAAYGKASHQAALESTRFLQHQLAAQQLAPALVTRVFQADATLPGPLAEPLRDLPVDIVFADIPYGLHSQWRSSDPVAGSDPLWSLLDTLRDVVAPAGIVAVISGKRDRAAHAGYRRLEHFQVGKRRVAILEALAR